jgi:septum site-determining protein MinC
MADKVRIKSFHNGICLELCDRADFREIIEEIAEKFSASKNFFGNAGLALSIRGRKLTKEEEISIIDAVQKNSYIRIICIVGHNDDTDRTFIRALRYVDKRYLSEYTQIHTGPICNGENFSADGNVCVLGDVMSGCQVSAAGNIIIMGGLYGEACAGKNGESNTYVMALEMKPEKLQVGGFKYTSNDKRKKRKFCTFINTKDENLHIAYGKNEKVVIAPFTKELLAELIQ